MTKVSEKRRDKRYQVEGRVLARAGSLPHGLFHIIDISQNGLAFRYLGNDELPAPVRRIDLVYEENLVLAQVPVQPVSDCSLACGYIPMRRHGLKFGELTEELKGALRQFIRSCFERESERHWEAEATTR